MLISENLSLEYDENGMGNIISKSGVGEKINYGEGTAGPNALTSIQNVETTYNPWPQTIGYTDFNKLSYMTDTISGGDSIQLSISYGFDNQRRKSILSQPNAGDKTKYFFGDYEIITDDNASKEFLFVNSPSGLCAIIESSNENGSRKQKVWHTYTDHLGSLIYIENADSTAEKREYSYDAWGNLRNHADWLDDEPDYDLIADRGYTGHEHLTEFGLINMNGRVYDPVIGRFLSADPLVAAPNIVSGYNRFAYVLNNPLKYIDPSGYHPLDPYYGEYGGYGNYSNWYGTWQTDSNPSSGGGGGVGVGASSVGPTYDDYMIQKKQDEINNILSDYFEKYRGEIFSIDTKDAGFAEFFLSLNQTMSSSVFNLSLESLYGKTWVIGNNLATNEKSSFAGINSFTYSNYKEASIAFNASSSGNSNFGGIVNATLLMAGGVAEMAVGGAVEFFSAGTSTPLTVPLILDGAGRTVSNAQRLYMYMKGNNRVADAYPTSIGSAIGKIGDLLNGVPFNQVGNGQAIAGTVNDFAAFITTGGSGFAIQNAVMYPSFGNWFNYGYSIFNYNYSMYDNAKNVNP